MTEWIQQYMEAWNNHDADAVSVFMAEDATFEDLALGERFEGRDAIREFVVGTEEFANDYSFTQVSEHAAGDRYVFEWVMSGTNTGDAGGLPATNKPFSVRGVSVGFLDADGKIKTNRDYWNLADYLVQIGILPAPGA